MIRVAVFALTMAALAGQSVAQTIDLVEDATALPGSENLAGENTSPDSSTPLPEDEPGFGETLTSNRPLLRDNDLPRARWERRRDGHLWTRVAMSAVQSHGRKLIETVPRDIGEWCPAYPSQDAEGRAKFWTAFLSTLTRYESTFNPRAVGGGGLWFGLLQIYPQTADFRKCRVRSGEGLKHGPSNLNCAVRIMAITVPRDDAISLKESRWKGVAADWGPIRNDWMRRDMQRYTKRQTYCRPLAEVRPKARPESQPEQAID